MKVVLLTLGSQGDVQPFVALALGLQAAGHHVRLATADSFAPFVGGHGIDFHPIDGAFLRLQEAKGAMEAGSDKWALFRQVKPMMRRMLDDAWQGAQGAELLVFHPKLLGALEMAEALGIPAAMAVPAPFVVPTRRFPSAIVPPTWRLGGWFNQLSYQLAPLLTAAFADVLNAWRTETLRTPRRGPFGSMTTRASGEPVPVLHAYSPHVVPTPDDWPAHAHVTGYWTLREASPWQPSPELARFLAAGPAPVYVGFGSMTSRDAVAKGRAVIEAVKRAGQRAVLASGWGALSVTDASPDVLVIDQAPHDRLFPLMRAVVHHGGAGTTAAGLQAGAPTLICPFFGDQPFWGDRVFRLGLGPAPIPQQALTVDRLAAGIRQVATDEGMRERAGALSLALQAEDGVEKAVACLARVACGDR